MRAGKGTPSPRENLWGFKEGNSRNFAANGHARIHAKGLAEGGGFELWIPSDST
jgi:hypothetical protein